MKKKIARRWLARNKTRINRDGVSNKDKRQIEKCFKILGLKVKANINKTKEKQEKLTP